MVKDKDSGYKKSYKKGYKKYIKKALKEDIRGTGLTVKSINKKIDEGVYKRIYDGMINESKKNTDKERVKTAIKALILWIIPIILLNTIEAEDALNVYLGASMIYWVILLIESIITDGKESLIEDMIYSEEIERWVEDISKKRLKKEIGKLNTDTESDKGYY